MPTASAARSATGRPVARSRCRSSSRSSRRPGPIMRRAPRSARRRAKRSASSPTSPSISPPASAWAASCAARSWSTSASTALARWSTGNTSSSPATRPTHTAAMPDPATARCTADGMPRTTTGRLRAIPTGAIRRSRRGAACSASRGGGRATSPAVPAASIRTICGATATRSNERMMRALRAVTPLLATLLFAPAAFAQEFAIAEVPSVTAQPPAELKPKTIAFTDHRTDNLADPGTGLIRFEDWARSQPLQKQILSIYPAYIEPTFNVNVNGVSKAHKEKLHMYVAEARFLVGKPPASLDLARFTTLAFLERLDPAIKHRIITPSETMPGKLPQLPHLRHPGRERCPSGMQGICTPSRYKFEGRLPAAITLANKLRESSKPVSDHMEFQSELRFLPNDSDGSLAKLTGLSTPVAGMLEQNMFWVNQILQFGRFVAVFQPHPGDAGKTVVSAFMTLAVKSDVLERKKEYETVPVLRNLVPAQVLVGNSSFNTGNSISGGLPVFVRNRIKAIAGTIEQ